MLKKKKSMTVLSTWVTLLSADCAWWPSQSRQPWQCSYLPSCPFSCGTLDSDNNESERSTRLMLNLEMAYAVPYVFFLFWYFYNKRASLVLVSMVLYILATDCFMCNSSFLISSQSACWRHQRSLGRVIHHFDTFYEFTAPDGDYRKGCLKVITARGTWCAWYWW